VAQYRFQGIQRSPQALSAPSKPSAPWTQTSQWFQSHICKKRAHPLKYLAGCIAQICPADRRDSCRRAPREVISQEECQQPTPSNLWYPWLQSKSLEYYPVSLAGLRHWWWMLSFHLTCGPWAGPLKVWMCRVPIYRLLRLRLPICSWGLLWSYLNKGQRILLYFSQAIPLLSILREGPAAIEFASSCSLYRQNEMKSWIFLLFSDFCTGVYPSLEILSRSWDFALRVWHQKPTMSKDSSRFRRYPCHQAWSLASTGRDWLIAELIPAGELCQWHRLSICPDHQYSKSSLSMRKDRRLFLLPLLHLSERVPLLSLVHSLAYLFHLQDQLLELHQIVLLVWYQT